MEDGGVVWGNWCSAYVQLQGLAKELLQYQWFSSVFQVLGWSGMSSTSRRLLFPTDFLVPTPPHHPPSVAPALLHQLMPVILPRYLVRAKPPILAVQLPSHTQRRLRVVRLTLFLLQTEVLLRMPTRHFRDHRRSPTALLPPCVEMATTEPPTRRGKEEHARRGADGHTHDRAGRQSAGSLSCWC